MCGCRESLLGEQTGTFCSRVPHQGRTGNFLEQRQCPNLFLPVQNNALEEPAAILCENQIGGPHPAPLEERSRRRSEGCAGGRAGWGGPAGTLPTAAPGEGTGCPPGAQPLTAPLLGKKQTEERDRAARKRSFWKSGITWRERRAERVVPSVEMSGVRAGRWPMLGGRSSNPSMSCCWQGDQRLSAEPALYKVTKLNAEVLGNKRNRKMSKNKEV